MRPAIFLFLGALLIPLAASAQPVQPLDRLLPEIRRTHPGKFYDADGPTRGPNGDAHYHLKWMTPDGRIEWLDTDARTGRVMGTSPGRDGFDGPRGGFGPPPPLGNDRGGYDRGDYDRGGYDRGGYARGRFGGFDSGPPPGYDGRGGEERGGWRGRGRRGWGR